MCLGQLAKFDIPLDKKGVGVGWKIFKKRWRDGKLVGEFYNSTVLLKNRWLDEQDFRMGAFKNKNYKRIESRYPFGWHIFLKRKDAKEWGGIEGDSSRIILKVKFRRVVATGYQGNNRAIVVAKELLIPNE